MKIERMIFGVMVMLCCGFSVLCVVGWVLKLLGVG